MRIFLIGYMGVGKTTLGKKLANRLNLNFIDLDNYIEKKHKASISFIFNLVGDEGFRLIEHRSLSEVIKFDNCIISTGGGTPCYNNNLDLIVDAGTSIYLKMPVGDLVHRLKKSKRNRPLISSLKEIELNNFVEKQLYEREFFYKQANLIVNVNNMSSTFFSNIVKDELFNKSLSQN